MTLLSAHLTCEVALMTQSPGTLTSDLDTDEDQTGLSLAAWWERAAAAVIDNLVVMALLVPVIAALTVLTRALAESDPVTGKATGIAVVLSLLPIPLLVATTLTYHALMESGERGATCGKRAMGIAVRGAAAGERISLGRALRRRLNYVVMWLPGITGVVNCLWPLWDRHRQALHDRAASTIVVRVR
jgi:uncharacterized RDD family membrane protein YckC